MLIKPVKDSTYKGSELGVVITTEIGNSNLITFTEAVYIKSVCLFFVVCFLMKVLLYWSHKCFGVNF